MSSAGQPTLDTDRRALAAHLRQHGPTHGPQLRAALGWDAVRFWNTVGGAGSKWFVIDANGWTLTLSGRDGLPPA